jgi:SAM-dependent methyltransferase
VEIARELLGEARGLSVLSHLPADTELFDYLMSFEVLEHLEDDSAALRAWSAYLKPGGTLLLSVPARMKMWSASDIWAGHFRRYELDELRNKVRHSGFEVDRIVTYGWPLSNCIEPIRAAVHRRRLQSAGELNRDPGAEKRIRTENSGVARDVEVRLYPLYSRWAGRACLRFFGVFQRLFFNRDWGTGHIVVGRKR